MPPGFLLVLRGLADELHHEAVDQLLIGVAAGGVGGTVADQADDGDEVADDLPCAGERGAAEAAGELDAAIGLDAALGEGGLLAELAPAVDEALVGDRHAREGADLGEDGSDGIGGAGMDDEGAEGGADEEVEGFCWIGGGGDGCNGSGGGRNDFGLPHPYEFAVRSVGIVVVELALGAGAIYHRAAGRRNPSLRSAIFEGLG